MKTIEITCGEGVSVKIDGNPVDTNYVEGKWYCSLEEDIVVPPLGVKPCWLAANCRIEELSEAITRQTGAEKPNYGLIKRWASEIEEQCNLIENDRYFDE